MWVMTLIPRTNRSRWMEKRYWEEERCCLWMMLWTHSLDLKIGKSTDSENRQKLWKGENSTCASEMLNVAKSVRHQSLFLFCSCNHNIFHWAWNEDKKWPVKTRWPLQNKGKQALLGWQFQMRRGKTDYSD